MENFNGYRDLSEWAVCFFLGGENEEASGPKIFKPLLSDANSEKTHQTNIIIAALTT